MTQPQDPTATDAANALADPDQNAVDSALNAYNQASANFNYWQQKVEEAQNNPDAKAADEASITQQADSARTQLASAARDYSNLLGRIATSRQANARAAKDPNEQQLWLNEADRAQSQADLYKAEANLYSAKTEADIAKAQTESQAAMSRATSVANRVQSQNDANQAQALLARTKAASIPALTQSTVDLHNSTIQKNAAYVNYLNARSAVSGSQVDLNEAKATFISGPQADAMAAQGLLRQAEADWIKQKGGATLAELQARAGKDDAAAGLSDARVQQIYANISKSQVLPYADSNAPTLDVFNPFTGTLTGQQNPAYKNPYMQPLTDRAAAIDAIKNDLAAGKFGQGQQAVDYANQLIDGISQAALYNAQGYTPQQYQQQVQTQANFGQSLLDKMLGTGQQQASDFSSILRNARSMPSMPLTPYSNGIAMGGGVDMIKNALSLIAQVKPITDRTSAMQAAQQYGQASQAMKQAYQQITGQPMPQQTPAQGQPPAPAVPNPSQQNDQAANSPIAASMAAPNPQGNALLQAAMAAGLGPGSMGQ